MNFEQFQASRTALADVSRAARHGDPAGPGEEIDAGYEYATGLYITTVGAEWPRQAASHGRHHLIIGNEEWIDDDLARLERILYDGFECELRDEPGVESD